jgi:hypothetical protein
VSGWRVQRSGVAIESYWWIRASTIGWVKVALPFAGAGSTDDSPLAIRLAFSATIPRV